MKRTPTILCAVSMAFLLCACGSDSKFDFYSSYPSGSISNEELDFSPTITVISTPIPSPSVPTVSSLPSAAEYTPAGSTDTSGSALPETAFSEASSISPTPTASPVSEEPQQSQIPIRTPAPTIAPAATQTPTTASAPVQTAAPVQSPAPTVYLVNEVRIAKSPTSETVYAGGSALFIARAENATSTNWITVSPDAKTSYRIQDAPSHFSGLTVEGQGTSNLRLSNIPTSMSGWRIQCYFTGEGGPKYTNGAYLTVLSGSPSQSGTPSVSSSEAESQVSSLAITTGQQLYSSAVNTYGYTSVTDITNYAYSNNQATYSMIFTNSRYKVIGQFKSYYYSSSSSGSEPMYAYIYDAAGTSIRGENLSGQSFDYFFTILEQYK
ncbi:MAG: hypothetical protein Q4F31_04575 [Eubacteriales bacterium]|nr:hypothetical protein [Eubacteriales bacterium]